MEHILIMLLWIATLFGYLQTRPVENTVNLMRTEVKCPSDSTFYAPEHVKEQCIPAAVDCIERELIGTVRVECEDPKHRIDKGLKMLQSTYRKWKGHRGHVLPASECVCEAWPQASFSEFLNKTKTLTEMMNALRLTRQDSETLQKVLCRNQATMNGH